MLSNVIYFPFTFVHPFSVFSQIFCWRSQCCQSVVISDIPRSLYIVLISTALAVPSVMSDSKTARSLVMFTVWSAVNVRLTRTIVIATHTVFGCFLHPLFGKLLACKFQDSIKSNVGLYIFEVFHNLG